MTHFGQGRAKGTSPPWAPSVQGNLSFLTFFHIVYTTIPGLLHSVNCCKLVSFIIQIWLMNKDDRKIINKTNKVEEKVIKNKADFAYLSPFNYRILK